MKKSNLYTATGDKGTTSLVGGKRVSKCDARLEAYGTTDELNAHIGLLVAMMPAGDDVALLRRIQDTLFIVGSALATDLATTTLHEASRLKEEEITCVEQRIDYLDSQVPPLCKFVLPGGATAAAQAHVCRTVCRALHLCTGRATRSSRQCSTLCQSPIGLFLRTGPLHQPHNFHSRDFLGRLITNHIY